ncbi:MAG TPA: RHS repeat-associated core domain-containing protein [Tepidisphaeraceae bacterium]|jgi:hypothetical protein
MSYSPVAGRFIERDPIGYADGMHAYLYERGNPLSWLDPLGLQSVADLFDDPNDGPLGRIGRQGASLLWAHGNLDQDDKAMTELFVLTQTEILRRLANGACPCVDENEKKWLFDTVRDFTRPLSESLYERARKKPINDSGWNQFFKDLDAGAFKKVPIPWRGVNKVSPFVPERDAVARAMALNHINNDLKAALQKNGIGGQALWDCIGKVVDDAARGMAGPLAGLGLDAVAWWDEAWDVAAIRDRMRGGVPATQPTSRPG